MYRVEARDYIKSNSNRKYLIKSRVLKHMFVTQLIYTTCMRYFTAENVINWNE